MLEIPGRQADQVLEDARAEHGIHPVAGVQDEVLPHPAHRRAEQRHDDEGDADDDEGVDRLVDDHLVDHHLGEQGRGEREELDRRRRKQDVAPDALVLEQFRHEPAETEHRRAFRPRVGVGDRLAGARELDDQPGEPRGKVFRRKRRRPGAAGLDHLELGLGGAGDNRQPVCGLPGPFGRHGGEHHHARRPDRGETVGRGFARRGFETEPGRGVKQRLEGVRWRKLAQDERSVEGDPLDLAHRGQREQHVLLRQSDVAHLPSPDRPLAR
jgi:hypothetical protein